ncbi:TetR/AcrR family transcriptional regulator [Wenzhouxiangellaceae bacterium CH-27]|uniref:TetR/AcrR family transcriptional regulator n=1 Tax=Elongatibacter sediminis TaxID=3119006 RepID=A0AAW9RGN7_9GAMM
MPRKKTGLSKVVTRKRPTQERSRDTVDKLLNVTEQLLEDPGLDRLTTVLIAKKAGLSVGTLYEYFPNKQSVLFALASRWIDKMENLMADNDVSQREYSSWAEWYESYARSMLELYQQDKGLVRYYDMLVSVLELRELDLKLDAMVEQYLTRSLRHFFPDLLPEDVEIMNRMIITNMHNVLRWAVNMPEPQRSRMLGNLHFLIQSLILKNAC